MPFETMFPNRFPTVGLFLPKNGRKGNFLRKNREFSLWSLHVLVSPGVEDAVMSKMMGRTDLMLLEAKFPNRFATVGLFEPKNGRKWNFLMKNRELSLWCLHVLVLPGAQGAVMSKMMGRINLALFEAMFPNSFQTVGLFQRKNGRKGNFLYGVFMFLFR